MWFNRVKYSMQPVYGGLFTPFVQRNVVYEHNRYDKQEKRQIYHTTIIGETRFFLEIMPVSAEDSIVLLLSNPKIADSEFNAKFQIDVVALLPAEFDARLKTLFSPGEEDPIVPVLRLYRRHVLFDETLGPYWGNCVTFTGSANIADGAGVRTYRARKCIIYGNEVDALFDKASKLLTPQFVELKKLLTEREYVQTELDEINTLNPVYHILPVGRTNTYGQQ